MKLEITIDEHSGFCFGVQRAIAAAEEGLNKNGQLFALGDIVHNDEEMNRLKQIGLQIIDHNQLKALHTSNILFRAHGEPPASYATTHSNSNILADATCPVVLKLQKRIHQAWINQKSINGQVVIYGKRGHAEVIGLHGQTQFECMVIESITDSESLDFNRPIELFSQTTQNPHEYKELSNYILSRIWDPQQFIVHNTICRQVSNRAERLMKFAQNQHIILIVGGLKSSNTKVLHQISLTQNPNSYLIASEKEIQSEWFGSDIYKIGIFGATSTPKWLMERIASHINKNFNIERNDT